MRTWIAVAVAFFLGVAGTWYLSAGQHVSNQVVPSAWAETNATAAQDKPWTAAELEEIAKFYDGAAEDAEDEALQYEKTAASITPLTDTKGFRRSALSIAAQSKWRQSIELRQLAAEHRDKSKRMYARERAQ